MPDNNIEVVLLGQGYGLSSDKSGGQKGQKVFHEAAFQPNPGTPVPLPTIGDPFSDDAPDCLVINIDMAYLNDTTTCGRMWTVTYQNDITEPDIEDNNPNEEDLQTTIEMGCEQISFEPPTNTWKWYGSGTYIATQPIFYRINTATVKVYRTIWDDKLDDFMKINFNTMGRVNSDLFWGIPQTMLLYEGANLQETRSEMGKRIWKAEMVFTFRTVTGNFTMGSSQTIADGGKDGWNWVLQLNSSMTTNPWDKPYREVAVDPIWAPYGKAFLYAATNFKTLLTAAGRPVSFPDMNWMS